jgi:ribonuclease Z
MHVMILGSNAAVPAHGRHLTSAVVTSGKQSFLLDCGEGTQMRMLDCKIKRAQLTHIFITHLHGDHLFGLPGLLTSLSFQRKSPLYLVGPVGLEEFVRTAIRLSSSHLPFTLIFRTTQPDRSELVYESDRLTVHTLPLRHRVPANGYLFREKPGRYQLIPEKLEELGIPRAKRAPLTKGVDYVAPDGHVIPSAEFALPPPKPASFAFCTDTAYHPPLVPLIREVDLLYHEATYLEDLRPQAAETLHSTALDAARIAAEAGVERLLLGHFSSRYRDPVVLEKEAKTVFPNVRAVKEGIWYPV